MVVPGYRALLKRALQADPLLRLSAYELRLRSQLNADDNGDMRGGRCADFVAVANAPESHPLRATSILSPCTTMSP